METTTKLNRKRGRPRKYNSENTDVERQRACRERKRNNTSYKEAEAIEFIKKHEPQDGYFVGFSGGKDSIVVLDLVRRAGVRYQAYFTNTGIEPPEIPKFIKENYPDVIHLKPVTTFWQGCLKKGFPLQNWRWCCDLLKKQPSQSIPLKFRIFGVRKQESYKRAKRGKITYNEKSKIMNFHPIFSFSEKEIWQYIRKCELKYPKLYDQGFKRIGCVVCPFHSRKIAAEHRQKFSGMYQVLDIYLEKVWNLRKKQLQKSGLTKKDYLQWPHWKSKAERQI